MKLKRLRVDGFRSVKEELDLIVDPKVTILIGANDHGKTTLLESIRCANDDRPLRPEDENWDSVGQGKPALEFVFQLDPEEITHLNSLSRDAAPAASPESERTGGVLANASVSGASSSPEVVGEGDQAAAPATGGSDHPADATPRYITFKKLSTTGKLAPELDSFPLDLPGAALEYLSKRVPRVELFTAAEQLMDVVTLQELENPLQEFMQGIFRYAGIWDERKRLFKQDPATAR